MRLRKKSNVLPSVDYVLLAVENISEGTIHKIVEGSHIILNGILYKNDYIINKAISIMRGKSPKSELILYIIKWIKFKFFKRICEGS